MSATTGNLTVTDDRTVVTTAGYANWGDLTSEEWEQLLLAVDDRVDSDESPPSADECSSARRCEKQRPCQSQRYRQRKRCEMAQLRSEANLLQSQLDHLQLAAQDRVQSMVPTTMHDVGSLAWKRIAAHQRVARRESETENIRLKNALARQLQAAKKLETLVQTRFLDDVDDAAATGRKRCRSEMSLRLDASVLHRLTLTLRPQLVGINAMLRDAGFADWKRDLERTRVADSSGSTVNVEVLFAKVFPFDCVATADAVWTCCGTTTSTTTTTDSFTAVSCTDSQIEMAFSIPVRVRHSEARVDAHVVMRRSKEAKRIVQWYAGLWVLRSEENETIDGVTLRDRGWHVIEDVEHDERSSSRSAIVQCCSQLEFDLGKVAYTEEEVTLRDTLLRIYHQKQQNSFKLFENVLIERVFSTRKC